MSLMIAPIVDLSYSELWHFVITVLESPIICKSLNPIEIPNFKACNPACASAANGVAILVWITDLEANISPPTFRTTNPEADLANYPKPTAEESALFICPLAKNPS
ncbi:hypothetical protein Golob_020137 [Gossypium lobatum]|uniref:Uncharacterized protein n=1 Tax=Gossypium lobatum TaxID=34289 RepID=A0A7J8L9G0_9ROSI|nr:hypothetical protein [Gossypium lobatum]